MKKIVIKWIAVICAIGLIGTALFLFYKNALDIRKERSEIYNEACIQIDAGNYREALDMLELLDDFGNAKQDIQYAEAMILLLDEEFEDAERAFLALGSYRDSPVRLLEAQNRQTQSISYEDARQAYKSKQFAKAYEIFLESGNYRNSAQLAQESLELWRLQVSNTISAGTRFSGGITEEGKVFFSGTDFAGVDEIGNWENVISVSACGELFAGLTNDGDVLVANWHTDSNYHVDVSDWKDQDIVQISVGDQFIVGLKSDGALVAKGIDGYGETDVYTSEWKDIVAIDTGWQHTVGLDQNGNIHVTGYHSGGLLMEIEENLDEWKDIIAISTGGSTGAAQRGMGHIVALRKDGHVVAVGDNSYGQCNVSEWTDIVAISAGEYHTVGLTDSGKVVTTQTEELFPDSYRAIEKWNEDSDTVAISAGFGFTLRLKSDGSVESAGNKNEHQADVADWEKVKIPQK